MSKVHARMFQRLEGNVEGSYVTITIYDFGAVSVEYRVPFEGTLDHVAVLSSELYDKMLFVADARARAESLLAAIGPAVRRAKIREETEDYLVFAVLV